LRRPLLGAGLFLLLFPAALRAQNAAPEPAWLDAVARATAAEMPILAYLHPQDCVTSRGFNECQAFADVIAHPAMQRRLRGMIYVKRVASDDAGVAVYEPSGVTLVRWGLVPDAAALSKILTLVDGATPDIVAAHRASLSGDANLARRHRALAVLALGFEGRGRAILEEMRQSEDAEDRELSSLWLDALRVKGQEADRNEELLLRLSDSGSTARVRFDALLGLASLRVSQRKLDDAIALLNRAIDVAPTATFAEVARTERQRAVDRASPVVGLGDYNTIVVGRRTVQPRGLPHGTARVEFLLDGQVVARAMKPPFTTAINFGRSPRRRVLELRSFDSKSNEIQRAAVVVNDRSDAFSIQLTEPAADAVEGSVDVTALVKAPRGRSIGSVTFEWRGKTVVQLSAPPYRTRIEVSPGEVGVLRAALRLDDGSETEDVRLLNAGAATESSSVHLVELPVHVQGTVPTPAQVVIREDGKRRTVERIIPASEAPLRVALLLDTSLSMTSHMFDLQESAVRYVERNIGERDRAMLLAFGSMQTVLWPTGDRALIERSILNLQPEGGTALYTSMISALLTVQSTGSRRAIVVFTDGIDTLSTFTLPDVQAVAQRMAVPIYVILFKADEGSPPGRLDRTANSPLFKQYEARRALMRMSEESGGKTFHLESLARADAIWNEIAAELNRQSLVIFRTSRSSSSWRKLDISAPGRTLRAPKGVYVLTDEEQGW
jgi:VWFA-related protein